MPAGFYFEFDRARGNFLLRYLSPLLLLPRYCLYKAALALGVPHPMTLTTYLRFAWKYRALQLFPPRYDY